MKNASLELQLGYYVGEYICHRYLPTLSTDSLLTRKVIQVSPEDTAENQRLEKEWFSTCYGTKSQEISPEQKEKWKAYYEHNKMLNVKYLPHTLKCYVPQVNIDKMNIDDFKKGLTASLWDSDACAYSLKPENVKISNDEGYFTKIEFILGSLVNED